MNAMKAGGLPGKPMWKVEGSTNYYLVFDGRYTAHRLMRNGRSTQVSLMHPRFDGLRRQIDAAIQAAKPDVVADLAKQGRKCGVSFFRKASDSPSDHQLDHLMQGYPFTVEQRRAVVQNILERP